MKFKYKKIAVTMSILVMGIGMITFSTQMTNKKNPTDVEQTGQDGGAMAASGSAVTATSPGAAVATDAGQRAAGQGDDDMVETAAKDKGLEKNAYAEVNDLVEAYMNAKLEGDEKQLKKLVDDTGYLNMSDIARRTERIEEYKVIDCYTLEGPEEGSYMVYVYSEVKVTGIETLATGLDGLYLRPDQDGTLKVCLGEVTKEVQKALSADSGREDVQKLIQEVNEKFVEEVKNDDKLAAYYEELSVVDALDEKDKGAGDDSGKDEDGTENEGDGE